jgi:hypothetical protein
MDSHKNLYSYLTEKKYVPKKFGHPRMTLEIGRDFPTARFQMVKKLLRSAGPAICVIIVDEKALH